MTRVYPTLSVHVWTAIIWALCLGASMVVAGADIFWIDGLAVDPMTQEQDEDGRFRGGLPTLAESGPRTPRTRLLDDPEPPRDPLIQRQIGDLAQEADRLARAGNLEPALMLLRDALALDPRNPMLLSRAAIHASTLRDFERAAGYFRRFLEVEPDNAGHLAGYAAVLLRLARLDETERVLRRAEAMQPDGLVARFTRLAMDILHEREPQDPRYWKRRSVDQVALVAQWLQADRETFIRLVGAADFERLCNLALGEGTLPHLDEINEALRGVQGARREGEEAGAKRHLDRLEALGVVSQGLQAERAEILFEAGRETEAVARWREITDRNPDWQEAWFNLALTLFRTDAYTQAVEALVRARSEREPPIVRFLLASALSLAGEDDPAREIYVELAGLHPDEFRQWMEADPRFRRAVRRMDIYRNLLRRIGVPPELE